jgi:hypothetical protein
MINLKFLITNPWWSRFENVYANAGKTPLKNKCWEFQIIKSDDIISFDLRITHRTDHAGIDLWVGLLGYSMNINLYDNRHWDHETNTWVKYD